MPLHSVYKDLCSPRIVFKVPTKDGKTFAFTTHGRRECLQRVQRFQQISSHGKIERIKKCHSQMITVKRSQGVTVTISAKCVHLSPA